MRQVNVRAVFVGAWAALLTFLSLFFHSTPVVAQPDFRRGDANVDGVVDVSDAAFIARILFVGLGQFPCEAAADGNGDGAIDFAVPITLLDYLVRGGPAPPPPGPEAPGPDPQEFLRCASYSPAAPAKVAEVAFGLECPAGVSGIPGQTVSFDIAATISTSENTEGRALPRGRLASPARG